MIKNGLTKRVLCAVVALMAGVLIGATCASANDVSVGDWVYLGWGGGNANNGGAFNVYKSASENGRYTYGFKTFCLEFNEHISLGTHYQVQSIDSNAYLGGVGGGPQGDPLDVKTACLYYNFRFHLSALQQIAGYHDLNQLYSAIQAAIWSIEQERDVDPGKDYTLLANNLLAWAADHWRLCPSLGQVQVMHLYDPKYPNRLNQDQIVWVPEPSTVLLLGAGLLGVGLGVGRRKRNV